MFLYIVQLCPIKDAGGHVLVLDALIGQQGGGEAALQVHMGQPLQIEGGDGVIALPQLLQGGAVHGLQRRQQPPGLGQKGGQALGGKAVGVHPHFLGGGDDDAHGFLPAQAIFSLMWDRRSRASSRVSSFLAKWRRTMLGTSSMKKEVPGTAATPTFWVSSSQNSTSVWPFFR